MQSPPPPTQSQAAEAQRARYAAEAAVLDLFQAAAAGGGSGEDDSSSLHALRIVAILALISAAIASTSPYIGKPNHEDIAERVLPAAQSVYNSLLGSELTDEQRAVLWATWAYSATAEEVAEAVNSGVLQSPYGGHNQSLRKVWISRSDARVRKMHAKLHGKTVTTSADFWRNPLTGQRLRWPGDKEAPPEATIGCRCVCLLTFADQDSVSDTIKKIVEYTKKS